jgi:hypothetical protein
MLWPSAQVSPLSFLFIPPETKKKRKKDRKQRKAQQVAAYQAPHFRKQLRQARKKEYESCNSLVVYFGCRSH